MLQHLCATCTHRVAPIASKFIDDCSSVGHSAIQYPACCTSHCSQGILHIYHDIRLLVLATCRHGKRHSGLTSILTAWKRAPRTLLRKSRRCPNRCGCMCLADTAQCDANAGVHAGNRKSALVVCCIKASTLEMPFKVLIVMANNGVQLLFLLNLCFMLHRCEMRMFSRDWTTWSRTSWCPCHL